MAYLDSSGLAHFLAKLKSSFLPTSGGTMSGIITRNGMLAQSGNTSGSISIQNGTSAAGGGGIWMYGASHANAGKVRIQAYSATHKKYCALDANGDGTLTWCGSPVLTKNFALEDIALTTPDSSVSITSLRARRYGRVIEVMTEFQIVSVLSDWTMIASGLPAPPYAILGVGEHWNASFKRGVRCQISTTGNLNLMYGAAGTTYDWHCIYLAA